ncbi:endonuclease/exonuclease/phosphatase family protein [Bacteroidota bacterium]
MREIFLSTITTILIIFTNVSIAQESDTLFIAFWNLENLFDTANDLDKNDEQFLPSGDREWTDERFDIKLNHLARTIRSMNNSNGPDILGVCEIEHQSVIDSMIVRYLHDKKFKAFAFESPDKRGIDNGLVYNTEKFNLLSVRADTVHLKDNWPTRPIVNVKLLYNQSDTLSVYLNHWPSRSGGSEKSEPNRISAATTIRNMVDEEFGKNPYAKIIVMGDFNDEPTNISVLEKLGANAFICDSSALGGRIFPEKQLFNTSFQAYKDGLGTYKYKDDWNMLDQIIVSGSLITGPGLYYLCNSFEVYKPYFIVTHSGKYKGAPFPTYGGPRYLGGYSDHYPVTAKFIVEGIIK